MLVHLALLASLTTVQAFERPPGGAGALHWLDVDRDGDVDLVAIDADGGLRLLRQDSARSFVDVSTASGLDALKGVRALVAADIDGDGLPDLVLGGVGGVQLRVGHSSGVPVVPGSAAWGWGARESGGKES